MNPILVIALSAVFVALAVATPVELSEEQKTLTKQYGEECYKEINLTEEEKARVKAKDFKNPTENMKCFSNCFFEKAGTLKDGVIQEDAVLKKLGALIGEEKTREALAKCGSVKGENNCDTATKLYECFEPFKHVEVKA
ncbi:general odorant-binding protein 56a [Drosophila grimshawi]|uniref:GH23015 n=1 Tax=Drosophila grimshawi TaxID=7222 RepID=B4JWC8_DROGR|nr:general odorant-binding protein 56a [Drosophila grimshawi]EDV98266.1 GH23015 [Drosophila grimshawi]